MPSLTDEGSLTSHDGLRLRWQRQSPAEPASAPAHVAVLHGYAEHLGRQQEVAKALVSAGHVVHLIDVRGHGLSAGPRAFVRRFDDYLADLDLFLGHVRAAAAGRPVFLVAHSNGGLIAARYLLDHPDAVRGVVLSSPYLQLKLPVPALKKLAARIVARVHPSLPMKNELRAELLTHDPAIQAATRADPMYLQIGTPGWFVASSAAQDEVLRGAPRFRTPVLVLTGSADPIADPLAGREFLAAVSSPDKAHRGYDGFLHELFNETGRAAVLADVAAWIGARCGAPAAPKAGAA
jgi:alpha-beta hydrolase superfamily lysophospholipase